jgi:hypothetical protein
LVQALITWRRTKVIGFINRQSFLIQQDIIKSQTEEPWPFCLVHIGPIAYEWYYSLRLDIDVRFRWLLLDDASLTLLLLTRVILTQNKYMYLFEHEVHQKPHPLLTPQKHDQQTNFSSYFLPYFELNFRALGIKYRICELGTAGTA